jgi:hypothetical protein
MMTTRHSDRWMTLDLPVWLALFVMFAVGMTVIRSVDAGTLAFADSQGTLRLRYPAGWLPTPGSDALLDVQNPISGGPLPARLTVTRQARAAQQTLTDAANEIVLARGNARAMYRVLSLEGVKIGGKDARAIEYAYVADPHEAVLTAQRLPAVVRGVEVVAVEGANIYTIDLRGPAAGYARLRSRLDRILREAQL